MNEPIAISLSPNTEADDVRLAGRMLLRPWRWRDAETVSQAAQLLSAKLNHQPVVLTSSGRAALSAVLKAYDIGSGDEVIIQAFTCIAVPEAIQWTGATPVYADIQETTFNIDPADVAKKITPKTKAIIVQHTFGIPGPLDELKALAQQHTLRLIEDCAHALGATYKEEPVGTLGDAAIFSFGRDKTLACVFGGAVTSRDQAIIKKIREQQDALPHPPAYWIIQQLLHPLLFHLIVPLYFVGDFGKALLVVAQKLHFLSKAVESGEKTGGRPAHVGYRFSPALGYLLVNQLKKLERYTAARQNHAKAYASVFGEFSNAALLRYPLLIDNPAQVQRQARDQQMLLGDWYDAPLAPKDADRKIFHYTSGSCPVAERVASRVINLPTYPRLTPDQRQRVIDFIRNHDSRN